MNNIYSTIAKKLDDAERNNDDKIIIKIEGNKSPINWRTNNPVAAWKLNNNDYSEALDLIIYHFGPKWKIIAYETDEEKLSIMFIRI
jgi:hypothetical protein